ncbi:MAG: catechol 2,3-dioxygenase [Bacilli bacterium]|jgi:catechol 2,3-dioxygenase|nr:catechol 2,3-dioxygenase [Bacilli bacterium]
MAIKGVIRAGFMQLRVLDMEKSVHHYEDILGLDKVGETSDGRVLLKGYDEFDHHSLILRKADSPGMDFMGFKCDCEEFLDEVYEKTLAYGLECQWVDANSDQPGFGRRLAVKLPSGHRIDLYASVELAEKYPGLVSPEIWVEQPRGMSVKGFDHALLYGPELDKTVKYMTGVLGFHIVERCDKPDGSQLVYWITSSNKPHEVAFLEYDKPGKLHHVAFALDNWNEIGHAADLITINDISMDAGPMRHGVTRGYTNYFFDPSGNRNETYAGGYTYCPDHPIRVWDMDNIGRGIFYYERKLNDRFLAIVT